MAYNRCMLFLQWMLAGALCFGLLAPWAVAQSTQKPEESTSRPQPDTSTAEPTPDVGKPAPPPSKSGVKRTLNKLDPHCLDAIFHTCWSQPAADAEKPVPDDERQAAKDIEVGYYYLGDKRYAAAESRLKEAVGLEPDSTAALIGLAQAQQKLGKRDEARQNYEAYLKLKPDGPEAEKVRKALAELK